MNHQFKKKNIIFMTIAISLLSLPLICHAVEAEPIGNTDISFYGSLIDQNSNPIPDVPIDYAISVQMIYNGVFLNQKSRSSDTTDNQGRFLIEGVGYNLNINPIEVPGYEFSYTSNPKRGFGYAPPATPDSFTATQANPFVFTLRKKEMPTYLLGRGPNQDKIDVGEVLTDNVNESVYLIPSWVDSDGSMGYVPGDEALEPGQVDRKGNKELQIEGSLSAERTQYTLEFTPLVPNSGILLSDQLLYKAPSTGYQNSVRFSLPTDTSDLMKYLYIKLDNGKFYGRLDTEFYIDSPDDSDPMARIHITSWIDPSGSRNLEYDPDFQFDEFKWRYLLYKLGGYGHFGEYVPKHKEHCTELVEEFGLSGLPAYENEDQFLAALRQLRAEKDAQNPQWWHSLEE